MINDLLRKQMYPLLKHMYNNKNEAVTELKQQIAALLNRHKDKLPIMLFHRNGEAARTGEYDPDDFELNLLDSKPNLLFTSLPLTDHVILFNDDMIDIQVDIDIAYRNVNIKDYTKKETQKRSVIVPTKFTMPVLRVSLKFN